MNRGARTPFIVTAQTPNSQNSGPPDSLLTESRKAGSIGGANDGDRSIGWSIAGHLAENVSNPGRPPSDASTLPQPLCAGCVGGKSASVGGGEIAAEFGNHIIINKAFSDPVLCENGESGFRFPGGNEAGRNVGDHDFGLFVSNSATVAVG